MPVTDVIQNAFTAGELDPKLRSRFDISTYYSGASKIRNAMIRPQGAVARRPGSSYLGEIPTGNVKMFNFTYSEDKTYTLILTENLMTVYKDEVLMTTIPCTLSDAQIPNVTSAQSYDTLLIFHSDFHPKAFIRENDTTWHALPWSLNNIPTFNYPDTYSFTSYIEITDGSGAAIDFSTWVPGNDYSGAKAILASGLWPSDIAGYFLRGPTGGYAYISNRDNDTELLITILAPFTNDVGNSDKTILQDGDWHIEERCWSDQKSYPSCGTFFQGRLWLGATNERPNTIWASRTNDESNFRNWIPSYADDGIEATAGGGDMARFTGMFGGKHLFIFADEGEFYVPISFDQPVTPTNMSIKRNSSYGSVPTTKAVEVDGSLVYIRKGGKSLIESTFNFANGSYQNKDLNLLASHVLVDPVALSYRKHTSTDDSDYVFVINADGSMAVLCTLREQDVTGWALQFTDGKIVSVMTENQLIYVIVDRVIDGVDKRFIEVLDFEMMHDAGVLKVEDIAFTFVSGLDHLIGETVDITLDNTIQAPQLVGPSGAIELDRPGYNVSIGLSFPTVDPEDKYQVYIESMPIEIEGQWGTSVMRKKRISEVMAMLYQTSHVVLNKNKVTIRQLGVTKLDQPLPLVTKNLSIKGVRGWDEEITVSAGQVDALPMQILSLAYKVRV